MVLGAVLVTTIAIRSDARADITITSPASADRAPNSFEPSGYDRPGTAANLLVQNLHNWTLFSNMGNLGIGNGSTATFGDQDSLPSNYSDNYFQAGDVSQEPLDPVRELNLNAGYACCRDGAGQRRQMILRRNTPRRKLPVKQNFSDDAGQARPLTISSLAAFNDSSPPAANDSQPSAENATEPAAADTLPSSATPENVTFAAYHPITAGMPVNDLLYEHPFASSISTYCRLVGLATPAGPPDKHRDEMPELRVLVIS